MEARRRSGAPTVVIALLLSLIFIKNTNAGVWRWSNDKGCQFVSYTVSEISISGLSANTQVAPGAGTWGLDGGYDMWFAPETSISNYFAGEFRKKVYVWSTILNNYSNLVEQHVQYVHFQNYQQPGYLEQSAQFVAGITSILGQQGTSQIDGVSRATTIEQCLALNPPDPCQDEWDAAVDTCGEVELVSYDDFEECEWHCNTCDDAYEDAQEDCPHGFIFDNRTCLYRCKDCMDYNEDCYDTCVDHDGVMFESCTGNSQDGFDTVCVCKDSFEPELMNEGTTPPATPDDKTPEPDPTLPNPDTSDPWSEAIKKNLDKIVEQGNDEKDQLANIAGNLKTSVDNQKAGAENITNKLGEGNESLEGIKSGVDKILDFMKNPTGNSYTEPGQPEYNTELPAEFDEDELIDPEALADLLDGQTMAYVDQVIQRDSPISASITATPDACLDGVITIHGNQKNISICFDRPWMIQGYTLMRVILIGVGYIQVIMMCTRALSGG